MRLAARWFGPFATLLAALGLVVSACGGGGEEGAPTAAPPTATAAPSAPTATTAPAQPTATRPAAATPTPVPTATFAPAPTVAAAERPVRGGIVTYRTVSDTPILDVTKQENFAIYYTLDTIFNNLLTYPVGKWAESTVGRDLATEWSFSGDGKTLTFKLDPNAKWQNVAPVNGRAVTAADVKFTFDLIKDPSYRSQIASRLAAVTAIEAPDAATVVLRLNEPTSTILRDVAWTTLNIVAPEAYRADGGFEKNVIGTGAFLFKSRVPNVSVTMARNPNYWKKDANGEQLPYLDGVEVLTIVDGATEEAGIRTGKIFFTTPGGTRDREQADLFRRTRGVFVYSDFDMSARLVVFNWKRKPLDDARVRLAIHKAVDYDAMRKNIIGKADALFEGYVTNGLQEYALPQTEVATWVRRDVAGAKQLLAQAGFPNGFKINIVNIFPGQTGYFADGQGLIRNNLKDIGIDLELIEPPGIAAAFGRRFSGDFDMALSSFSFEVDPIQWLQRNHLSTSTQNDGKVNDPKLDELILAARRELNKDAQIRKIQEAQRYMMQIVPTLIFGTGEINIAQLEKLKGYRRHAIWGHAGLEYGWIAR